MDGLPTCGRAALQLLICLALLLCAATPGRAQLEEGPVPGKEAYEPSPRFSEAIIANGFIFLSGTPGTPNTTIQEQTAEVLMTFNETLTTLGSSLDAAVMSRVFLNDTADFAGMNSAYTQFFTSNPPARTTVGAHILGGSLIEIDIMALAQLVCPTCVHFLLCFCMHKKVQVLK